MTVHYSAWPLRVKRGDRFELDNGKWFYAMRACTIPSKEAITTYVKSRWIVPLKDDGRSLAISMDEYLHRRRN